MQNPYCDALKIAVPSVEKAAQSRDACIYSLLIAVLLEHGGPVTLEQAAKRIAAAGVGDANNVLDSLKRCRPARPPIYRDGEFYELDPHDDEADLWAFRLGLRPPKVPAARIVAEKAKPEKLPSPETPLTTDELTEAWRRYIPTGFSSQRLTISVLDAHGRPMKPEDIVAYVQARMEYRSLYVDTDRNWGNNAPVRVREDGLWELRSDHEAVRSARHAVRKLIKNERRNNQQTCAVTEAEVQIWEKKKEAHAAELERLQRVLIHAFPIDHPKAFVLIDLNKRQIKTFLEAQITQVGERLKSYEVIVGVEVRHILRILHFDQGDRRLHELGATQKTRQLNRRGRTLKITTEMLIRGSCGIARPFGDKRTLLAYLCSGQETKFRKRLEADAKSLFALYQYGRLHHCVRLYWGFIDEKLSAPWAHYDESCLYDLMRSANEQNVPLEIVAGSAPGWEDPWSRARAAYARKSPNSWHYQLFDADGYRIDEAEVQAACLMKSGTNLAARIGRCNS
ncbi:MAG: hypothetical protein PHW60_03630 [Kiritimatiellae bacterium]|nr:hypothetical protein [Kiritimatiellia bacterium]